MLEKPFLQIIKQDLQLNTKKKERNKNNYKKDLQLCKEIEIQEMILYLYFIIKHVLNSQNHGNLNPLQQKQIRELVNLVIGL